MKTWTTGSFQIWFVGYPGAVLPETTAKEAEVPRTEEEEVPRTDQEEEVPRTEEEVPRTEEEEEKVNYTCPCLLL